MDKLRRSYFSSYDNTEELTRRWLRPRESLNPLQRGIVDFINAHVSPSFLAVNGISIWDHATLFPKRYTLYPPLCLLPQSMFTTDSSFKQLVACLTPSQLEKMYTFIVSAMSSLGVTHLAVNAPIAATLDNGDGNRIRLPSGVVALHGDFGHQPPDSNPERDVNPTETDLNSAFWVHTKQCSGISQIWAPLFTMFSRGNISEKERILGIQSVFEGLNEAELGQDPKTTAVVDMYAGIGYFVFPYLRRGVGRVWAWELNGWSVEGLRRGCEANGYGFKSIRVDPNGNVIDLKEFLEGLTEEDRVVAFHGDNKFAVDALAQAKKVLEPKGFWKPIRHANLGLLPTSKETWGPAVEILDRQGPGWIHVHENVSQNGIDDHRDFVVKELTSLLHKSPDMTESSCPSLECRHVERVKSYAPGVMHCVFDICVPFTVPKEENH